MERLKKYKVRVTCGTADFMKTRKEIIEKLKDLIIEKNQMLEEFQNEKETGTSRECADNDMGEIIGKIKMLEWVLSRIKIGRRI